MALQEQVARAVYLRFEGRIGVWDGQTPPVAYSEFVNLEKIELTVPQQEQEKLISNMTTTYGAALDSQNKPTDAVASGAITFSTMTPAMIALAIGANVAEATQTSTPVTGEAITTVLDVWVPLANNRPISAFSLDIGGVVSADDYELDTELGMVRAIAAGAAGTGTCAYTVDARTWEEYAAGLATSEYVHITGQATDKITEQVGQIDIWRGNFAADGTFDPAAGGYLRGSLTGDLIKPSVAIFGGIPASPWRWLLRTA